MGSILIVMQIQILNANSRKYPKFNVIPIVFGECLKVQTDVAKSDT